MSKKVRFDDHVRLKYMDINLKDHRREVKDPTGEHNHTFPSEKYTFVAPSEDLTSESGTSFTFWLWIIGLATICIIILLVWYYYFTNNGLSGKNAKKNLDE